MENNGPGPLPLFHEEIAMVDERSVDAIRMMLEKSLSIENLCGHAFEIDDLSEDSDPFSPAAIMRAMDSYFTLPLSYIITLPCVRAVLPLWWDEKDVMRLLSHAALTSTKIVVHDTPEGTRIGPFPHASLHSRCTLCLKSADSTLTVARIQHEVPECPIFFFRRVSENSVNVTFENPQATKKAFILLQRKSLEGYLSLHVKMRLECGKGLNRTQQLYRPNQGQAPVCMGKNNGGVASQTFPVFPADVCSMTTKIDCSPPELKYLKSSNSRTMFWNCPASCDECMAQLGAQQRDYQKKMLSGGRAENAPYGMYLPSLKEQMMASSTDIPVYRTPWDTNALLHTKRFLHPHFPTCTNQGNKMEVMTSNSTFSPYGKDLNRSIGEGQDMYRSFPTSGFSPNESLNSTYIGESTSRLSENLSSSMAETANPLPSRRMQRDPYKGGIYVDALQTAIPFGTVLVPPGPPSSPLHMKSPSNQMLHMCHMWLNPSPSPCSSGAQGKMSLSSGNDVSLLCLTQEEVDDEESIEVKRVPHEE